MRLLVLCAVIAVSIIYGQQPCGCPYQAKKCTGCDATKLFNVASGNGSCTVTCERGYMLESPAANYAGCEDGTIFQGHARDMAARISLGSNPLITCVVAPPKYCPPDSWKPFDCETCDPTRIIVTPGVKGVCTMMCDRGFRLVASFNGVFLRLGDATLNDDKSWILMHLGAMGTSSQPRAGAALFFNCERSPGTPAPPAPEKSCNCPFADSGAAQGMEAPVSFCANSVTQMLQCDEKIYVKNGDKLSPYDSVSCSGGRWYGTGCDGFKSALNNTNVSVQCGGTPEPPFCPQLPTRDGLKYMGMEGGLQRYACEGDKLARLLLAGDKTVTAKYFDCNANSYRAVSSNGAIFSSTAYKIIGFSCRDYGKLSSGCSTPLFTNAWLQDGLLRCVPGFYTESVTFFDSANKQLTGSAVYHPLVSAKCESGVWKVDKLVNGPWSEVQLTNFLCRDTPATIGSCAALSITPRNVQFNQTNFEYVCLDSSALQMEVVTPAGAAFYGYKLACVNKEWKFTGVDTVSIPANSKVSCKPLLMGVFPPIPLSLPLIPVGKTPEGLTRWTCIDSTVTLDIEFHPEVGKRMPANAAYIDANNTFYRFSSSIDYIWTTSTTKINSISCTDMGPKHSACSDPLDIGGIRKGNRYECMKGFALNYIRYVDGQGAEVTASATETDTKSMECTEGGWKLQGTSLSDLRVSRVHCYDVSQYSGDSLCAALNVTTENYKLEYDYYRKIFTCNDGTIMGYTLNGALTKEGGRKMYCGKTTSGDAEWKWSYTDGTNEAPIPLGAKISCF